jgi:hypothetical protein
VDSNDVTFAYGSQLETLEIQTGAYARRKRDIVRRQTDSTQNFNASNFLGDVALALDHDCKPISQPINGLNDSTVITSLTTGALNFVLYQSGSSMGHHGFNFIFAYNKKPYRDLIGLEQGPKESYDHSCTCMAGNQMCPDGSDRCCLCRFDCSSIGADV